MEAGRPDERTDDAATAPAPLPTVPFFTGREREVHLLAHLLTSNQEPLERPPFAVLSGAPGIGKTALALHTAHTVAAHYPGGCVLLPLTRPDGTPKPVREATDHLRGSLAAAAAGHGRTLLILDDVVHPDQVRALLTANAGGAAIVTSRMGLAALVATHGGTVHRLGALEPGSPSLCSPPYSVVSGSRPSPRPPVCWPPSAGTTRWPCALPPPACSPGPGCPWPTARTGCAATCPPGSPWRTTRACRCR